MSNTEPILSEDLFFSLIEHVTELVTGVEKIIGIYNDPETEEVRSTALEYRNNRLQEQVLNLSEVKEQLTPLRQENSRYRWLDKSQLPFNTGYGDRSQLNIFDEYKHLILLITLPGAKISGKNILLIYFKDDINSFGVQHQKSSLSTDNKSILAHILSGSIHSYCKLYWNEKDKLERFSHKTRRILEQQRIDNVYAKRKEELEGVILSWAQEYLDECSNSDGFNYVYSLDAQEKIKNYTGEFSVLRQAVKEAIEYTKMIVTGVNKEIQAEFIDLNTDVNNDVKHTSMYNTSELSIHLQRVYEFLDRLETASIKVDREGQNLTGTNVGNAIEEKPISAAAISDYISKHREQINSLFNKYPDRWSFSKNNFKSIINVRARDKSKLRNQA